MKRTKSVFAMILTAMLCFTVVCPALGAETAANNAALNEIALEAEGPEEPEELRVQEEVEEPDEQEENAETEEPDMQEDSAQLSEMIDPVQIEEEQENASENGSDRMEDSTEAVLGETAEAATEAPSSQEKDEGLVEITESEQIEDHAEALSDSAAGEDIVQAILTAGDSTLTFYYGPKVSVDDSFGGRTVLYVYSGVNFKPSAWSQKQTSMRHVVFDASFLAVRPTDLHEWFKGFYSLESVDLSGLDTSEVTDMSYMFYQCNKLKELDVSGFDTSNVTDMSYMFYECWKLKELDVSGFDTSKVRDMSYMFSRCSGLTSLDISGLDTSGSRDMSYLFGECTQLTSLDISGIDTSNVEYMGGMFYRCSSLPSLDVSGLDTSRVRDMSYMFYDCEILPSLDVSGFDTSNARRMDYMFGVCKVLTNLDVSGFDTSHVEYMNGMFYRCDVLESLDVSGFDTSNVMDMSYMFYNCLCVPSLDVSGFDTSNVFDMNHMFSRCSLVPYLDVSGFDTSKVTDMSFMFEQCNGLTSLDVSGFDTSSVTNMSFMFQYCIELPYLDVSGFDTSKVTDMSDMFECCWILTELDTSGFDTSNVTNMSDMFSNCLSLKYLDVRSFDTSKVTTMEVMFSSCSNLTALDLSSFDTSNVTTMEGMFDSDINLAVLDLSSFDPPKRCKLDRMFKKCKRLRTVFCKDSSTDWSSIAYGNNMFGECQAINGREGSTKVVFDSSKTTSIMAKSGSLGGYFTPRDFSGIEIEESGVTVSESVLEYTGWYVNPDIEIIDNYGVLLEEGYDFTVTYENNIEIGTATATIKGNGIYTGTITRTFEIIPIPVTPTIKLLPTEFVYSGERQVPYVSVFDGDRYLSEDYYDLTWPTDCTSIGEHQVVVTLKGKYSGTATATFTITPIPISDTTITGIYDETYNGNEIKQDIVICRGDKTLIEGTDYTVEYVDGTNVNAGTGRILITGIGEFMGTVEETFTIYKTSQSITAKSSASTVAVGKTVTISTTGGKGTVTYTSSDTTVATVDSNTGKVTGKKVGTVTITAKAAATTNYNADSKKVTIKVVPAATSAVSAANQTTGIKLTWKKVTGANGYYIYRNGTKIKTITSGATVTYSDTKANTNGAKYTYKIVAKASTGTSMLSKSVVTYRIAKPAISSLTSGSAGKLTVKWGKNAKASGYYVQYCANKNFSSGYKTVTITKNTTVSRTIGSLTKGKTYYVRVRSFKTVNGKKYYSAWSAIKVVTVKK